MELINKEQVTKKIGSRILKNSILKWLFLLATSFGLIVLAILIYRIFTQGFGYLNLDFFTNFASRRPADAGIKAAIFGTIWLMAVTGPVSIVLGVGCAIYLELYAKEKCIHPLYSNEYFQSSGRSFHCIWIIGSHGIC